MTRIRRLPFLPALLAALLIAACNRGRAPETEQAAPKKPDLPPSVEVEIQRRLEHGPRLGSVSGKEEAELGPLRRRFYQDRRFTPAWSEDGWPLPSARAYLAAIDRAQSHGLEPARYGGERVSQLLSRMGGAPAAPPDVADLDVLLTEGLIRYAVHLSGGIARGEAKALGWPVAPLRADLLSALESAPVASDLGERLESLAPAHPQYAALRRALARYREIEAEGGWPEIPPAPPIERGTSDPRVPLLRARLRMTGDLSAEPDAKRSLELDKVLVRALRRFQSRHGLSPTGRFGPETATAIGMPLDARIRQLLVNLERLRWFPPEPGERYVLVNVPDFRLALIDHDRPAVELRAIVGEAGWPTPLLDAEMTQVIFNPYWLIPQRIAREEILPKARRSPDYLLRNQIEVVDRRGHTLDPTQVRFDVNPFPYRLRQRPGEKNQLGQVKFVFPNPYGIFIHDTPGRTLFTRYERDLSHGCVRIERPVDFAAALLESRPNWPREAIEQAIASGERRTVKLPESLPIRIVYWTAWVDDSGEVELREDLYGHDATLAKLLAGPMTLARRGAL